ncbi:HMG box-containing protein 4 isoform X2 [Episyrphus balteatus]|uniref:HMG box-containing protein 4 isoform X2 n=1 Tax=Episyrphus balteatus TaxID=286459 RepID=UPI00248687AF|nr:HMG box-containing protein 4 isoform X2 [Episyrphus balteatus]
MESPNSSKEFEITGVSRSGRVRKKSSKLLDFRSPDEIEPKSKKTAAKLAKNQSSKTSPDNMAPKSDYEAAESDEDFDAEAAIDQTLDDNTDTDEDLDVDVPVDDESADEHSEDPVVQQSLYMSEKSNKKRILKDGKVVMEKAQRKDKGKSRFTAYMLWVRDARRTVLNNKNNCQELATRKLGEMWANVPANEKSMWRRRAKRLAKKTKQNDDGQGSNTTKSVPSFINRATTSRTKKIAQQASSAGAGGVHSGGKLSSPTQSPPNSIFASTIKIGSNTMTQPGAFKVTGIEPIDVAAHLKLLGDSLSIIGERLKEHEGQITVSGSLSVLLDSLLCSIVPLVCLTTQIPGMENRKGLSDNLHATMDNIAYIMPGL